MTRAFAQRLILLLSLLTACRAERDFQEQLDETISTLHENCPQKVDSETRLDDVTSNGPLTLVYKYTLVNLVINDADTSAFSRQLRPGLLAHLSTSTEMKRLRDNKVTFEYDYRDRNGKHIAHLVFSPHDYQ